MQLLCVFWIVSSGLLFTEVGDEYLPSFSYWNMASKLIKSPSAQRQLDVSSDQLVKLEALRSSFRKEFDSLLQEKRRAGITANTSASKLRSTQVLDQIATERNADIKIALKNVLSDLQIDQLRPVFMRAKFQKGNQPFFDEEVLTYCGLSTADHEKLNILLEKELQRFHIQLAEIRDHSIREIVKSVKLLPTGSIRAFAHLVGNNHFPEIKIANDFPHESIPFPSVAKSIFSLGGLAKESELQHGLGLTTEQIAILSTRFSEFELKLRRTMNGPDASSLYEESSKEMLSVLNDAQRYGLFRALTGIEFEKDFVAIISAPQLMAYLDLSASDYDSLKLIAQAESENLKANLNEANKSFFNLICDSLPADSRARMQRLFKSNW